MVLGRQRATVLPVRRAKAIPTRANIVHPLSPSVKTLLALRGGHEDIKKGTGKGRGSCANARDIGRYRYTHIIYIYIYIERENQLSILRYDRTVEVESCEILIRRKFALANFAVN